MTRPKQEIDPKKVFPVTLPPTTKSTVDKMRRGVYSDLKIKELITRHKNSKLKENGDAADKRFLILGEPADRFEYMLFIVAMVSEGMQVTDICELEGSPTLLEVRHWRKWHSNFDKELKEAEACRGERLGEESLQVALDTTDESNAAIAKLKSETLAKAAARLNSEFQERKLIQTEDITDHQTYEQLMSRWNTLSKQFPELKTLSDSVGVTEADIVDTGDEE